MKNLKSYINWCTCQKATNEVCRAAVVGRRRIEPFLPIPPITKLILHLHPLANYFSQPSARTLHIPPYRYRDRLDSEPSGVKQAILQHGSRSHEDREKVSASDHRKVLLPTDA
ncbi:unnamed protein product [Chondrus crispus]|uniref:Uncharacterized protein n=1 Tax=Chondrus crispus TaxID=2769 RepID=R7QDG1_CHOCR|nr:unnamed protein product [Chondrus crispus]CDF35823.1 unnamed protein product [Chondrus crispus]|eukprot:XP_005715643.1 unnamed protein product [Chondrus crispus]